MFIDGKREKMMGRRYQRVSLGMKNIADIRVLVLESMVCDSVLDTDKDSTCRRHFDRTCTLGVMSLESERIGGEPTNKRHNYSVDLVRHFQLENKTEI
jgi:hypothetical protein